MEASPEPQLTIESSSEPLTLAVIGCGTMGVAILSGILSSLAASSSGSSTPLPDGAGAGPLPTRFPDVSSTPPRLPSKFIACVKRPESAERVRVAFEGSFTPVTVLTNNNVEGAKNADVILLCCKPQMYDEILNTPKMREALSGKLLVSILAGVKISDLKAFCPSTRVVRAMPNTASKVWD